MRIMYNKNQQSCVRLHTVQGGVLIRFKDAFHQTNCRPDDLFIVNSVSGCYRPEKDQYRGKIAVTNVFTGHMSYLDKNRFVEILPDAVVLPHGWDDLCELG